jgi:hypothetical protein
MQPFLIKRTKELLNALLLVSTDAGDENINRTELLLGSAFC